MNIKQAKEEIKHTVQAYLEKDEYDNYAIPTVRQRPVFLIGPPGIGKTAIMEQIARECHIALVSYTITHHTRQSAIGLPFIVDKQYNGREYSVTEYTMSEIVAAVFDKIEATGIQEGILFIDEINCVSETLAPTMLQFLQGKTFGNHRVPEGWTIVAAGNPPEYNQSVRDFDVVTLDRVKRIYVDANYPVWKNYAYENGVHPAIISYLDIKKENFFTIETTVDGKDIVTARGWEDLSKLMQVYEKLEIPVDESVIIQYIQNKRIAKDFSNYLDLYRKYQTDYDVEAVVEGRIRQSSIEKIKQASFDEKLSVISLLISKLTSIFSDVYGKDMYVRELYDVLLELKYVMTGESAAGKSALACVESKREHIYEAMNRDRENGVIDTEKYHALKQVTAALADYKKVLSESGDNDCEVGFNCIKELFAAEPQQRKAMLIKAAENLDHAFEFIEAAFGESQEMVIFITELNANALCVRFIRDNGSKQYDRYNKALLFDERQQDIMKDISEVADFVGFLD